MNRVIVKIAFFALVVVLVGAANSAFINGPLLQNNTAVSMNQFNGTPAPAGDFQVAGYWFSFNSVDIVEVVGLTLLLSVLFLSHLLNLILPAAPAPAQEEVYVKVKRNK